jgi:hypothetical protein
MALRSLGSRRRDAGRASGRDFRGATWPPRGDQTVPGEEFGIVGVSMTSWA